MQINPLRSISRLPAAHAGRALAIALVAVTALLVALLVARGLLENSAELRAASIYPEARPIEPFELQGPDGESFDQHDLQGNLTLLFFGFTNCPDICPDTLAVLAEAMDKLRAMRVEEKPEVVFVSVDPERDAGRTMREYVSYFDPAFRAVTGDDDALSALTGQVGAMYVRHAPDETGFYSVDHSGMIVLIDAQGRMFGRFPPASGAEDIAADLFALSRARG